MNTIACEWARKHLAWERENVKFKLELNLNSIQSRKDQKSIVMA